MIREVINYVKDKDLKIIYINNHINIINYGTILEIKEDIVTIKKYNNIINVRGNDLKLCKLLDEEILITGNIKKIEL